MSTSKQNNEREGQERRRFRRFSMQIRAHTCRDKPKQADDSAGACTVDLQDFSLGGVGVTSTKPAKEKEPLTLVIPPYGHRPKINLTGRVAHCRRQSNRYLIGIEFCHTKEPIETSPWLRVPELFYLAGSSLRTDA